jgi:hypothetical protein
MQGAFVIAWPFFHMHMHLVFPVFGCLVLMGDDLDFLKFWQNSEVLQLQQSILLLKFWKE